MEKTKQYTDGDLTVFWTPAKCIHSTVCWKGEQGLGKVFKPKEKPWINLKGASHQAIMNQIQRCPSGALAYQTKNKETMSETNTTEVQITPNGPILVHGKITVKHTDGREELKDKVNAFCRCGASSNKPFCDGTHTKNDFKDE